MPRKTKETKEIETQKTAPKTTKKTSKKSTTTSKKATNKTASAKKSTSKATNKATSKKKTTSKKTSTAKSQTKKTTKKTPKVAILPTEYYDLPYNYNKTVVKLLAQTPTTLFVYWEISEADRENYKKTYGENFFETTKPILIVHNDTMNYSFEVEINDFANSWYLHVNDSKCDYRIELGRRFIENNKNNNNNNNYVYISSSNELEAPNNKILFDKNQKMVYFRNVKTNTETRKDISTFTFIRNIGKIYNIYDLYKEIYKNENIDELSNPSSNYKGEH